MRLEVEIAPKKGTYIIPINYHYPLSTALRSILFDNDGSDFRNWMFKNDYTDEDVKPALPFTFSRLFTKNSRVNENMLASEGNAKFVLTLPVKNAHEESFIDQIRSNNNLKISNDHISSIFKIMNVKKIPYPHFKQETKYKMLSPTILTKQTIHNGKSRLYYYRPHDEELPEKLENNLKFKYEYYYEKPFNDRIKVRLDKNYLKNVKRATKLITIKEGDHDEVKLKTFICPLTISAPVEIHKIAYSLGIGEMNDMGFGMIEELNHFRNLIKNNLNLNNK